MSAAMARSGRVWFMVSASLLGTPSLGVGSPRWKGFLNLPECLVPQVLVDRPHTLFRVSSPVRTAGPFAVLVEVLAVDLHQLRADLLGPLWKDLRDLLLGERAPLAGIGLLLVPELHRAVPVAVLAPVDRAAVLDVHEVFVHLISPGGSVSRCSSSPGPHRAPRPR